MSKTQIVKDLCNLCDLIMETSDLHAERLRELNKKYPFKRDDLNFTLLSSDHFNNYSLNSLRKYDLESLQVFLNEAVEHYDLLMNEEVKLELFATKLENQRQKRPSVNSSKEDQCNVNQPLKQNTNTVFNSDKKKTQKASLLSDINQTQNFEIENRLDQCNKLLEQFKSSIKSDMRKSEKRSEKLKDFYREDQLEKQYLEQIKLNEGLQTQIEQLKKQNELLLKNRDYQQEKIISENQNYIVTIKSKSENIDINELYQAFEKVQKEKFQKDISLYEMACNISRDNSSRKPSDMKNHLSFSEQRMKKINELEKKIDELDFERQQSNKEVQQALTTIFTTEF